MLLLEELQSSKTKIPELINLTVIDRGLFEFYDFMSLVTEMKNLRNHSTNRKQKPNFCLIRSDETCKTFVNFHRNTSSFALPAACIE